MASSDFEKVIEKACTDLEIAGAALLATNRDGSFTYSKSFGKAVISEDEASKPFQLNSVMWIGPASCTKLLTTLSALHLASSNDLSLDDPELITKHLPELASRTVLQPPGEDGLPREAPRTKPLTLRHLLTHTSGLVYDMLNPLTIAWTRANNKALGRGSTLLERYDTPLAFEPGASWMYSTSIDYVGLLVERASGDTLEAYMKTHFWEPLGIKDMTFHLSTRPDMKERLVDMSFRTAEGKVSAEPENPGLARMPFRTLEGKEVDGCFGGEGLFATPEEYIKVLRAVLDGSIVPASFAQEVFKPQLSQAQADAMNGFLQMDVPNNAMGHTKKNVWKNWGLGGLLLDADDHDKGRKEGTMIWTGLPMLSWFVDRKTGICGFFATQIMPTGDQKAAELMNVFVDGIYALASSSGKENGRL